LTLFGSIFGFMSHHLGMVVFFSLTFSGCGISYLT
jgi:hypothetical protein